MTVQTSPARLVSGLLTATLGICAGFLLAAYAEADDAPGGVLIAGILMLGSLVLGLWIAFRGSRHPAAKDG